MNFVIVIDWLYELDGSNITIGGIQTYLVNLSEIIYEKYKVKPLIYQSGDNDFHIICDKYEVFGIACKSMNIRKKIKKIYSHIKDKFSKHNTVVIWGSDQYSLNAQGFKSINIQHGIGFDTEALDSGFKSKLKKYNLVPIYKLMQRINALNYARNGNKVVCVDYNFKNWIKTFVYKNKERFVVIPNFADTPCLSEHYDSESINILIARRFVKRRGIDLAVKVARQILNNKSNINFTFAGSGPEQYLVDELKKEYPNSVYQTSYKSEDSIHFHQQYDIAIVPSIGSEGTSLSLLEAMSAKCLVIATDIGGMTNIILDGFNGRMIPPIEEEMIACLNDVIDNFDEYQYMRDNGRNTVEKAFSKDIWKHKWIQVIDQVLR
ncbi:glycosyltransferase family 4 protein [Escherichia coli]|uniref:glycosyltransferase family 4 protein n=1 Tax=Escherichia coli TaxID=562 RepID=UPI0034658EC8